MKNYKPKSKVEKLIHTIRNEYGIRYDFANIVIDREDGISYSPTTCGSQLVDMLEEFNNKIANDKK